MIYAVIGQTLASGRHDAKPGDVITVTATAEKGYTLTGPAKWGPFTFAALPATCANAPMDSQPLCATPHGTYTIPTTEGVT